MANLSDKITTTRQTYIPQGSQKIALKDGSAVLYLFTGTAGRPCVRGTPPSRNGVSISRLRNAARIGSIVS